jgi:hypothetical protein
MRMDSETVIMVGPEVGDMLREREAEIARLHDCNERLIRQVEFLQTQNADLRRRLEKTLDRGRR